ncbi:MAG: hypothetical protein LBQ71_10490 [Hungatella sp.]|jgi:hypothetical protein|nr:hypothetical protein [Hungatella sp.]
MSRITVNNQEMVHSLIKLIGARGQEIVVIEGYTEKYGICQLFQNAQTLELSDKTLTALAHLIRLLELKEVIQDEGYH